jgi:endonuclease/exonuclease/phosphatase family metal-dependent hydrolase
VDHVLVSPEIAVGGFATGANTYSDHLPVIADLLLPLPDEAQSVKANPAR